MVQNSEKASENMIDPIKEVDYSEYDRIDGPTIVPGETVTAVEGSQTDKCLEVIKMNRAPDTWSEKFTVARDVYPLCLQLVLTYIVTIGNFPSNCFAIGAGLEQKYNIPTVILLYNIGDFLGKFISNLKK